MTVGDLTSLCRNPCDGSGCWRADCRSACFSTARGGGDPIPVAARCGAAVAPRGADRGLRGPPDEPGFVGGHCRRDMSYLEVRVSVTYSAVHACQPAFPWTRLAQCESP